MDYVFLPDPCASCDVTQTLIQCIIDWLESGVYVYRYPREHISMHIFLSVLVLPRKQVILVGKLVLHIGVTHS